GRRARRRRRTPPGVSRGLSPIGDADQAVRRTAPRQARSPGDRARGRADRPRPLAAGDMNEHCRGRPAAAGAGNVRALPDAVGGGVHRRRHRARPGAAGAVPGARADERRPGQPAGRGADLADDRADAAQGRFHRAASRRRTVARHRRHRRGQLAGQAVQHGRARLAVRRLAVPAAAAGGADRRLHRRADPACGGDANFTLTQVALNDTIMVFAFAPIVGLLLGLSSIAVPWQTLLLSVVLYIVVPVIAAQWWRRRLGPALGDVLRRLQPVSLAALLATLVLLFGFQGEEIIDQPLVIALLAVPIV